MVKQLLSLFILLTLCVQQSFAVLPDGAPAENWTLTDLDGNTHTLYDILDEGKPVVLDFSATWCGPCWNYHNQHILSNLHNAYGPNGTDQIRVFFVEADISTETACLYYDSGGCSSFMQGDWVTGTPYPIIDLNSSTAYVRTDYNITYFPTLYAVSTDRRVWEVGQVSQNTWTNWLFNSFPLDATADITPSTCGDNGSITVTPSGGQGFITYTWSHGASGATVNNLEGGTYTVTMRDGNGYFVEKEFTVTGSLSGAPMEVEVLASNDAACFGEPSGSAEVAASFGNYNYSYEWSDGTVGPLLSNVYAGIYNVVVTDGEGCTTSYDVELSEPAELVSNSEVTPDACAEGNGTVIVYAEGGTGDYLYDFGSGPQTLSNFYGLSEGVYNYSVIDENGCINQNQFEIEVSGLPTAQAEVENVLDCIVTTTTVSGEGSSIAGFSYLWTTTTGNITTDPTQRDITVDAPGVYILSVSNTQYGCTETAEVTVVETANPPAAVAASNGGLNCAITSTVLNGTGSSTGNEYTYNWTTTDGNITAGVNTLNPTVNGVGNYTLVVTNTTNGCTSSSAVSVSGDYTQPTIASSNATLTCTTTEVQLCATVDANVNVTWTTPDGNVDGNCVTVNTSGSFTATAVAANGCSATSISIVDQSADIPQTSIAAPSLITCAVREITLEGSVTGDLADYTIEWRTTTGNIVSGENTLNPMVNRAGAYVMRAVHNTTGCASSSSVTVTADLALPLAQFSVNSTIGQLTLNNTSSNFEGDITWDLGNGQTATGNEVTATYNETGIYTICVTVSNECGAETHCQDIQFVTVMTQASTSTDSKCNGEPTGSITVTPAGGLEPYTIVWTGPNGFMSNELTISNLEAGEYRMVLTDAAGNEVEESYTIDEPSAIENQNVFVTNTVSGQSIGAITIIPIGGTGDIVVEWSNGMKGASIENLPAGEYTATLIDANGCTKVVGPFVVEATTGLNDLDFVKSFTLSPNPAVNQIHIIAEFNQTANVSMEIRDHLGRVISSNQMGNRNSIDKTLDVNEYNSGTYILLVRSGESLINKKFIVIK